MIGKCTKNDKASFQKNAAKRFLEKEVEDTVGKNPNTKTRVYIALSSTVPRKMFIWKEPCYSSISPTAFSVPTSIQMGDFFVALEDMGFIFVEGCYVLRYN